MCSPASIGDSARAQIEPSKLIFFCLFHPKLASQYELTRVPKPGTLPVTECSLSRAVSERRNMVHIIDISRQTVTPLSTESASSAERLSLTFMSLGCVTQRDPGCPPAEPRPRPFSPRRCHSAWVCVSRGQGVAEAFARYQSQDEYYLPGVTYTDALSPPLIFIFPASHPFPRFHLTPR